MPVYDYKCQQHGVFCELAKLEDSSKPNICPQCKELAPRIIMVSPEILDMAPSKRHAHETNEKAQHEPAYSTKERRENDEQHSNGCGCDKKSKKSKLFYTAAGEKMFPSMRPWMISH
ncbi:zinc ribbon domain-containing protein [Teredinibacter haidensis]|uniref:zinc ribbon domain-containing protein n=1 Tax=Teredinibacter haidensis TaxID=2731755 RepID=UPI000948F6A2|nr:zinc ribbon domain-containing protein [Teredinibacter haidensis]